MLKTLARCLACAALLFTLFSCTPIPEPELSGEKSIPMETLPVAGSIPAEWGDLVAVTVNPSFSYQYQLWFQDEQGAVRLVVFDNRSKQLLSDSRLFPRSGGGQDNE
jgi:hypothetical protein